MKAVNPEATREYILNCDRDEPPEKQTKWKISQITHEEQAYLKDLAGAPGTQIDMACHLGLAGAENFLEGNGEEIEWKRDGTKRPIVGLKKPWAKVLTRIPLPQRDELAAEIIRGADMEVIEAKNS